MTSKHRYRFFVDPTTLLKDSEEPPEPPTKRKRVLSVEQLASGCVLIRVDFKRAKGAGSPAPLR